MFICQATISYAKNLNVRHYVKIVKWYSFIYAIIEGTIDLFHYMPFSMTLFLIEGHKVSRN